ncbi:unnamed protein product [Paramecium sonneborni]|nr:unnamed protein product [Paramecium sonneborni]
MKSRERTQIKIKKGIRKKRKEEKVKRVELRDDLVI